MHRSPRSVTCVFLALALLAMSLTGTTAQANHYVVSCVGDSLTQDKYPSPLRSWLSNYPYHTFTVFDFGIGGMGSWDLYTYAGWWLAVSPDIVLIMLGTNDLYGAEINGSDKVSNTNLTMIGTQNCVTAAKNSKSPAPYVIVAGIPPSKSGNMNARVLYYNQTMERDLQNIDLFIWDNYYTLMNADGSIKTSLLGDVLHPVSSVYNDWAENWYHAIVDLLNEPDRTKESPYSE